MTSDLDNIITEDRRAATPGLDHPWFEYSPLSARPRATLPGGRGLAFSVVVDLTAVEWEPNEAQVPVPAAGGRGVKPFPDIPRASHREYGHRVGIFRLLRLLEDLNVRPAVVVDVLTAQHYPRLVEHLLRHDVEYIAGGVSGSRPITSLMSREEEEHYVEYTLHSLEAVLGIRPNGWLSPERSESATTPGTLGAAGLGYVADWGNDEQPFPFSARAGTLWSYPLSWELADVNVNHHRGVSPPGYARAVVDAVARMVDDGATHPRALGLHLHPWVSGQAFRIRAVGNALSKVLDRDDVWMATPGQVVAAFRDQT